VQLDGGRCCGVLFGALCYIGSNMLVGAAMCITWGLGVWSAKLYFVGCCPCIGCIKTVVFKLFVHRSCHDLSKSSLIICGDFIVRVPYVHIGKFGLARSIL
jgi:hypothetical protein